MSVITTIRAFFATYRAEIKDISLTVVVLSVLGLLAYIACSAVLFALKFIIGYQMASLIAAALFACCATLLGYAGGMMIAEALAKRGAQLKAEAAACAAAKPVRGERV